MLVIDPDVCIDCGVCIPECPAKAIKADTEEGTEKWVALGRRLSQKWPTITDPKAPLPDADAWATKTCKLKHLREGDVDEDHT